MQPSAYTTYCTGWASPLAGLGQNTQRQPQNPHKRRLKKSWNGDKTPYRKGIHSHALDEASYIIGWNTQNGWYPIGMPVRTPVSLSRKRFHSFGALHQDGFVCRFAERANSGSFIAFLEELRKRFGKVLIYLDNAGYHKSVAVKEYVDGCGGDVVLRYLPPYTPELNPVEIQWRMIRKATGNRLYQNTEEMKKSIRTMLDNAEVGVVKMFQYLT